MLRFFHSSSTWNPLSALRTRSITQPVSPIAETNTRLPGRISGLAIAPSSSLYCHSSCPSSEMPVTTDPRTWTI